MTICSENRKPVFIKFPVLKQIADKNWKKIPERYEMAEIDEYIIMPDHIHGIIFILPAVGAGLAPAHGNDNVPCSEKRAGARPAPTIGNIVGSFKSLCLKDWLEYIENNNMEIRAKFWQRGFYDHVIRNEKDLSKVRGYIQNNPEMVAEF